MWKRAHDILLTPFSLQAIRDHMPRMLAVADHYYLLKQPGRAGQGAGRGRRGARRLGRTRSWLAGLRSADRFVEDIWGG